MFDSIQKEIDNFIDRGFDRSLRLAVTGLSRSGKTAFITSFINQLLHINSTDENHLPLFDAARDRRILAVKRVEQRDLSIPRFEYENNLQCLGEEPPIWPNSTIGVHEIRLAIRYKKSGFLRHIKETGTLYIDIFDYPGEWLLDLPLLELNFQQWSEQQSQLMYGMRRELAQQWLEKIQKLDLTKKADEDVLAQLAKCYTQYLLDCKKQGLHFIQPGRFVLPGELDGSPAVQFFPLIHIDEAQWKRLRQAENGSYFSILEKRYNYYCQHIVKQFYKQYFSLFDRQVILADCLTSLNYGQQSFLDMQEGLKQLFESFRYGKRTVLHRLFAPKIDKLMFLATKADHITNDQWSNLISLLRHLVQDGHHYVEYEGIETSYGAIASVRSTQQVRVNKNGKFYNAIQGVRQIDQQKITVYPGEVPKRLPNIQFWQKQKFEFDQFSPQRLEQGGVIPHFRMDTVLQFLLADKLT
ncbi:YcjX family protein [Avibacterium paragallinarum]|uniref:YcjX family protein n=1 Tax=Avibacterium paragallinarum TaxID=728 RepID=UPI00021AD353|nr:YcjX family protein [Avibacterium paragallinarum]AZI14603.1 YcjX family protein [Avibacterium paragallinarum]QJE10114.1 GTP-binding protein YcjX [Avibacterium paragallinarum]QJE12308.1 GTP-binding protein YcjX [Avibacterium paragallinarum]QJE14511.1 GTP-binding protein YcjX [Avibacterium paragallinarum]QJE16710.1 GTP-binding protein YcjX [Avibacterium paragallinarum]